MSQPLVLGINAAYHESAAALVRGSEVLFAVEDERLTRVKHGKSPSVHNPHVLPDKAIEACLAHAGVRLQDVDALAYSLQPGRRRAGVDPDPVDTESGWGTPEGEALFERNLRSLAQRFPGQAFHYVRTTWHTRPPPGFRVPLSARRCWWSTESAKIPQAGWGPQIRTVACAASRRSRIPTPSGFSGRRCHAISVSPSMTPPK